MNLFEIYLPYERGIEKPRRLETVDTVAATSGPSMNFCHSTRDAVLFCYRPRRTICCTPCKTAHRSKIIIRRDNKMVMMNEFYNYLDKRIVFNGNRINDRVLFLVTPHTFSVMMAALFRTTGRSKSELSNQMI